MPLILDTGIIYALADTNDRWHQPTVSWLETNSQALMVPVTVVPEATYMLRSRLGLDAESRFVESLAGGELALEELTASDLNRCVELLNDYPDIGFVDASVIAMCERMRLEELATTDRRHFSQVRPRHCAAFHLLP